MPVTGLVVPDCSVNVPSLPVWSTTVQFAQASLEAAVEDRRGVGGSAAKARAAAVPAA
jgi:hypothetical protein